MTYEEIQLLIKEKDFDGLWQAYMDAEIPENLFHNVLKSLYEEVNRLDELCKMAIPTGPYCYESFGHDADGGRRIKCCPFWDKDETKPRQEDGICHYLETADWEEWEKENGHIPLLWDQCKECGINDDIEEDDYNSQEGE